MRQKLIGFLKCHPGILNFCYRILGALLNFIGIFVKKKNKIIFASYGGRKFDDSPYVLYKEICGRPEFNGFELIWAFVNPDAIDIPRGRKIKIDTPRFFYELLSSRIWISNTGADRDIGLSKKKVISVETWHGCPLKKICGEENENSAQNKVLNKKKKDALTIRCAQSEYDLEIFARVFNAEKSAFVLSDLPRNDELTGEISVERVVAIKEKLGLPQEKKVMLYMPTYREFCVDEHYDTYLAPPVDIKKWKARLQDEYILLIRAHYAVNKALNIVNDGFVVDVSTYPLINDLYIISDILISDYSSAYVDYSVLKRPMLCFAYDYDVYNTKRGLYLNLYDVLPCPIDTDEDALLDRIATLDYESYSKKTENFQKVYAPYAGNAAMRIVDAIVERIQKL